MDADRRAVVFIVDLVDVAGAEGADSSGGKPPRLGWIRRWSPCPMVCTADCSACSGPAVPLRRTHEATDERAGHRSPLRSAVVGLTCPARRRPRHPRSPRTRHRRRPHRGRHPVLGVDIPCWDEKGCRGAGGMVRIPCRGRREILSAGRQAVNRSHARIRALVELPSPPSSRGISSAHCGARPPGSPASSKPSSPAPDRLRVRMERAQCLPDDPELSGHGRVRALAAVRAVHRDGVPPELLRVRKLASHLDIPPFTSKVHCQGAHSEGAASPRRCPAPRNCCGWPVGRGPGRTWRPGPTSGTDRSGTCRARMSASRKSWPGSPARGQGRARSAAVGVRRGGRGATAQCQRAPAGRLPRKSDLPAGNIALISESNH